MPAIKKSFGVGTETDLDYCLDGRKMTLDVGAPLSPNKQTNKQDYCLVSYILNYRAAISDQITCWEAEQFPLRSYLGLNIVMGVVMGVLRGQTCFTYL